MIAAPRRSGLAVAALVLIAGVIGCRTPGVQSDISVVVVADGARRSVHVPRGATVADALEAAGVALGKLDTADPPAYSVLSDGDNIVIARVHELFVTEQIVIAFERQTLRNDALPQGESRLVQAGISGLQEITYRVRIEDGVETNRSVVKAVVLKETLPEIMMVGAQGSLTPLPIEGKLVYLAGGNAWVLENSTSSRRLLVSSGDLDGRIFALSPNADFLLFTRRSKKPADEEINTLWAVSTANEPPPPFSLHAANIVHFADWIPGTNSVAYSTVEPRGAAPGWQANNDLHRVSLAGGPSSVVLEASAGGVYGWWGMSFGFSPDGRMAYARPDQVGLVDQDGGYLKPLLDITPFNTRSDWVWVPSVAWGTDGETLILTTHASSAAPISPEDSPRFDLAAAALDNGATAPLAADVGMFAYASSSPAGDGAHQSDYQVAFLEAILPEESDRSGYRLSVMDRDGSNRQMLFPMPDAGGLEPQIPVWSPGTAEGQTGELLGVVFQGDLWLVDTASGGAFRATGDGMITRIDWQ